jgi:hypothetical protein
MLDVARLLRMGEEGAEAAHAAASKLATHRAAHFVAEWLVERGGTDPDPALLDADTGGALTRLATLTESARGKLLPQLHIETFTGRVADVPGRTVFVIDEEGRSRPIPAPTRSAAEWAGALVVVDTERLADGATTIWTRRAFDSVADPGERVPGTPRLLTPAEQDRLKRPVASAQ